MGEQVKRAVIRFKDETIINIPAEGLEMGKTTITVWNGAYIVAIVKTNEIISCHISEQAENN